MSHVFFWPVRTFFYPVGNTPAICLTESLPPEQQADVLLLGCGDPRHILYTVYVDDTESMTDPRKLDVTCCDTEGAVLARNTLLFTLLSDEGAEKVISNIWNIFYHMMLDETSLSLLIAQCRKLIPLAKDLDSWKKGPYSHIVPMCNEKTLSEICYFWSLWLGTASFSSEQAKRFRENFREGIRNTREKLQDGFVVTSMRSAGPLAPVTFSAVDEQFRCFWSCGVTDDGSRGAENAKNVNPTFAFSASGDRFAVHYGTDPVSGFHFAESLASRGLELSDRSPSLVFNIVQAARHQFSAWCMAVIKRIQHSSASSASLVVRMYAGEALAFCQALRSVNRVSGPHTPCYVASWKASTVRLDDVAYGTSAALPAPTLFNVIETSNLLDHVGFHNLFIVAIPLLRNAPSSTLYSEALLSTGGSFMQGILEHIHGDPSTISLLLGVIPSTYISRFTTRSNMSDILLHEIGNRAHSQYHERLAWKLLWSARPNAAPRGDLIRFTPDELARALFDIYLKMFSDENLSKQMGLLSLPKKEMLWKIQTSGLIHHTRRSFALLLAHIKTRVQCDWEKVINDLEELVLRDHTLITGSNFYQEMVSQLHLAGFPLSWLSPGEVRKLHLKVDPPIFREWQTVPLVVTVALVVPRQAISRVQSDLSDAGTPILQCEIRLASGHNAFACISGSFGRLEVSGRGEHKTAVILEDSAGIQGTSPLIVWFPVLSTTLIHTSGGTVGLAVRSTMRSTPLVQKLGLEMVLFKSLLTDERHSHILSQAPVSTTVSTPANEVSKTVCPTSEEISGCHPIHVAMDKSSTQIQSLTARADIVDFAGQTALANGCNVVAKQKSLDQVIIHMEQYQQAVAFPLPVDVEKAKLRVARKSKYVEVVAPTTLMLGAKGESNIAGNFRVTLYDGIPTLWNVHYLNLERCPAFKLSKSPKAFNWLVPHVSHMFSNRERDERQKKLSPDRQQDTFIDVKESIHTIFLSVAGFEPGNQTHVEFALRNPFTKEIFAIIIVTDLRLDLASHTVVADSWILPGSDDIQDMLQKELLSVLSIKTSVHESEAWRHLLPLLIERCRTWKHKPTCEYLSHNSVPLYPEASSDPNKVPFCSCGMGIGTKGLLKRYGSVTAAYATRAAISPLFPVLYLEKTGTKLAQSSHRSGQAGCKACGKENTPLSSCGKCKKVKYCSRDCQVKDWKTHKKDCT